MAVFPLTLRDGDDEQNDVLLADNAPAVGDRIDTHGRTWRVEEVAEELVETPDGDETFVRVFCFPA